MANSARGEADLVIGGKPYSVSMSMGALARIASALEVKTFDELSTRILEFKLTDMPLVVDAVMKGNGYDVPMSDIEKMDGMDYLQKLIPAFFRTAAGTDGAARPQKRQKA